MKKERLSQVWSLLTAFGLLGAAVASGDSNADQYVHKTLKNGNHTAEVEVDNSKVTVHLRRDSDDVPQSVLLTFYDKDNQPTTLELKALAPASEEPGVSTYTGSLLDGRRPGEASGSLSPSRQSFVGFELSIPLSKGSSETLRLKSVE